MEQMTLAPIFSRKKSELNSFVVTCMIFVSWIFGVKKFLCLGSLQLCSPYYLKWHHVEWFQVDNILIFFTQIQSSWRYPRKRICLDISVRYIEMLLLPTLPMLSKYILLPLQTSCYHCKHPAIAANFPLLLQTSHYRCNTPLLLQASRYCCKHPTIAANNPLSLQTSPYRCKHPTIAANFL